MTKEINSTNYRALALALIPVFTVK